MEKLKVGFIGLGNMGEGMAKNVLKAGYYTTVYDIKMEPLEKLNKLGAKVPGSSKEVAANADVVITMVRDNAQTEQVIFGKEGVLEGIKEGGGIIIMSTVGPMFAKQMSLKLKKGRKIDVLAAPVSGTQPRAEAGTLSIMVGGDAQVFQRYLPLLKVMGKYIFYCGPSGTGLVAKLTNNLIYGVTMATLSEAVSLGVMEGIDLSALLEIYKVSTGGSWAVEHYDFVTKMRRDKRTDSLMELLYKDLRLLLDFANGKGVPAPITAFCSQLDLYDKE